MFGEQQIDRLFTQSLSRGVTIKRELSELLPGNWVKIDRENALSGPARRSFTAAIFAADNGDRRRVAYLNLIGSDNTWG
jgi:hypothetical protein